MQMVALLLLRHHWILSSALLLVEMISTNSTSRTSSHGLMATQKLLYSGGKKFSNITNNTSSGTFISISQSCLTMRVKEWTYYVMDWSVLFFIQCNYLYSTAFRTGSFHSWIFSNSVYSSAAFLNWFCDVLSIIRANAFLSLTLHLIPLVSVKIIISPLMYPHKSLTMKMLYLNLSCRSTSRYYTLHSTLHYCSSWNVFLFTSYTSYMRNRNSPC